MTKFRAIFCFGVALAALIPATSCTPPEKPVMTTGGVRFDDRPRHPGHDVVMVVTPFAPSAHALWASMRDEISEEIDLVTLEMTGTLGPQALSSHIAELDPQCVVLIGNQSARVYRALQQEEKETPPAVVLMSSFAEHVVSELRRGVGIAYEVPAITSIVTLRQLSERPLKKVGVLFRPAMKDFVEKQAKLAELEKVSLVGKEIDGSFGPRKIRLGLRHLIRSDKVDAIWVLNDNALLTSSGIRDGWLPEARVSDIPIMVGVSNLVNSQLSFGSLAVVPDHSALGVQAANLLFELSDNNWSVEGHHLELPLSVETVVDMTQADVLRLAPDAESMIDRTVSANVSPLSF